MHFKNFLPKFIVFLLIIFSSHLFSCVTQPTIHTPKKEKQSEIEKQIQKTQTWVRAAREDQTRKKMLALERALGKRLMSEADWKLHDELLEEYIHLKQLASTHVLVPPKTKFVRPIETYCLNSNQSAPAEKEVYHWQKGQPPIPYYKGVLGLRRENIITQAEAQEVIWNLRNKTPWEEYPEKLKAILQKIDPKAPLKLPSRLKSQATDSLVGMASGLSGAETARDLYRITEGRYHQFNAFAAQVSSLTSQYELPQYDALTPIPSTKVYSQSRSNGYSGQTLTLYNPSDDTQEIDLEDYYLDSERKDVQDIGINPHPRSALLIDLENLLFETMLRAGIGFTPAVNDVADLYELFSGKDFITGEHLSPLERSLSGLGLIAGSGNGYRYAQRMIYGPEKYTTHFIEGIEKVSQKKGIQVDTRLANESLQKIRNRPHQVRTAEEVNRSYSEMGHRPPYKDKTRVVEFESLEGEKWVRLHGSENQKGIWIVREEAVKGLSPEQLRKKYSLPKAPTEISEVTLPKGIKIRRGRVAENFGGNSGAVQYEILGTDPQKSWFGNRRPLP